MDLSKENAGIEMDLAFGSTKPYGSSRSIVRRIATSLPLKPCQRVQFQLNPYTEEAGFLRAFPSKHNFPVASLADVGWIDREEEAEDDDEDYFCRNRAGPATGLVFRACQPQTSIPPLARRRSLPSMHGSLDPQGPATTNKEAFQKISVLETELAKLRVQIAQIVLAQEKSAQPAPGPGVLPPAPPPPAFGAPPPPPPPPPPPLPPPAPGLQRAFSAIELIKERKGRKLDSQALASEPKPAEVPSMLDVLKDMGKVKLRSIKSRQGDGHPKASEPRDAASLIAEALKRKFAHRHRRDSVQEDDWEFQLPIPEVKPPAEAPLFGQHLLKSTGTRKFM